MKHIFTLILIFAILLNGVFFYSCNKTESSVPVADFSIGQQQAEAGKPLQLQNESSADAISWRWYAPGSVEKVSEVKNPVFRYTTPGTYDVSLTVYNGRAHHSVTKKKCITVTPQKLAPVAIFTASAKKTSTGKNINFIDQSLHEPGAWEWSFPGGIPATSDQQNPENIVYNTPGTYNVSLRAINEVGSHTSNILGYIIIKEPKKRPERAISLFGKVYPLVKTGDHYQLASDVPASYLLYATVQEESQMHYEPLFVPDSTRPNINWLAIEPYEIIKAPEAEDIQHSPESVSFTYLHDQQLPDMH
jgi:PKD repeat protein